MILEQPKPLRMLIGKAQIGSAIWEKAVLITSMWPKAETDNDDYNRAKGEIENWYKVEFGVEPEDIHWRTGEHG